jgi:putative transcriptional regulator
MCLLRLLRPIVITVGVTCSAAIVGAALQPPTDPGAAREKAPADSLTGQLLVASPSMQDPRFFHTVILVVRHDTNGALGIVINRLAGERPLSDILVALGERDSGVTGTVRIFAGGPVQPEAGFVVHSAEYRRAQTIDIDGRVALTSSLEILHDIGKGQGPQRSLIAFGYAGWRHGQLEEELQQQAWFTAPEDQRLVFEEDRDKVWDDAMKRRTQDL